ncbi:tetratricopeptide repeat protein [Pedobacter sp.]|uniref:tetratricopeptide repeat-containing sensor histidine kinase n=1 Tax=Pedobacter sp. TaxID=1411316 RepID=UPI0031E0EBAD
MKKLLTSLFILLCFLNSYSQDLQKIDSLKRLLKLSKEDTSRVSLLIKLTKANKNNDITSAYKYCSEAINLSKKLKYNKGLFKSLTSEISLIRIEGKDGLALEKSKSLVQFAENTKDSFNIAAGYLTLGEVYDNNGDNKSGVAYCLKGLRIAERMNDRGLLQDAYAALQRLYFSRTEFDKAVIYGQKAIDLAKAMGDKNRVMIQSYNLAQTYNLIKAFDKSIKISNEVVRMAKQAGDKRVEVYALYNLCSVNLRTNNLNDALTYGKQCLAISKEISDKSIQSNVLAAIGSIYLQLGQNKEAENNLLQALALREKTEDKQGIADVQNILADVYFAMGQPKKAYDFEKASEDFSDNYNQSILAQQSSDLEKKYETQKKESQIRLQQADIKRKNILNYVLLGGVSAILIISVLGYRNYKHRQKLQQAKIDELETEKQLTATAAVLKGEEQERTRLAKDLHDGLGGMLSGIKFSLNTVKENLIMTPDNAHAFERSIDMLNSSIKEMRRVAHNMMPEILVKYGLDAALKEFCTEIDHSGVVHVNYQSVGMQQAEITQTTSVAIYRIVQELLNNTIKHAHAKNVLVQLHQSAQEKLLAVTVEDDGNGFDTELLKQSAGMGWLNIRNRVEFLKGKIDMQSGHGKGTSIMIEIAI